VCGVFVGVCLCVWCVCVCVCVCGVCVWCVCGVWVCVCVCDLETVISMRRLRPDLDNAAQKKRKEKKLFCLAAFGTFHLRSTNFNRMTPKVPTVALPQNTELLCNDHPVNKIIIVYCENLIQISACFSLTMQCFRCQCKLTGLYQLPRFKRLINMDIICGLRNTELA